MDGLFLKHGPLRFVLHPDSSSTYKLEQRHDTAWTDLPAYILYIDQPVGTGLSFTQSGKYPRTDAELALVFGVFFQHFLTLHADKFLKDAVGNHNSNNNNPNQPPPQKLSRNLFLMGESFAGHYLPVFADHLQRQLQLPVTGVAIGNGLFDGPHQFDSLAEYAYAQGWLGRSERQAFRERAIQCQRYRAHNWTSATQICTHFTYNVMQQSMGDAADRTVSVYDIRLTEGKHEDWAFPPGHHVIEAYLGGRATEGIDPSLYRNAVLPALHALASLAAGQRYQECTDPPYFALAAVRTESVVEPYLVLLLDDNPETRILFFNGVLDVICNHMGNERALTHVPWKHRDDWNRAPTQAWTNGKTLYGYVKQVRNLEFIKVLEAGHMVPLDQPETTLAMMRHFVFGRQLPGSA